MRLSKLNGLSFDLLGAPPAELDEASLRLSALRQYLPLQFQSRVKEASPVESPPAMAADLPQHRHHTCPKPRVKRASPEGLPASPVFMGVSSLPTR